MSITKGLRITWLFVLLLTCTSCFESKIETIKIDSLTGSKKMNGVVYALPRTIVTVDVPVIREDRIPGKYERFADCFFPGERRIKKESLEFTIDTGNVRFGTSAVPDPDEKFLVKTQGGMFETRSLELALTESGVFVKGTGETKNDALDILTATTKSVVALAAKGSPGIFGIKSSFDLKNVGLSDALPSEQEACLEDLRNAILKMEKGWLLDEESLNKALKQLSPVKTDEEREQMKSSLKEVREGALSKTDRQNLLTARKSLSDFLDAVEVYKHIASLQKQREELLDSHSGMAMPSETLKLMLSELETTIKGYKDQYFTGVTKKIAWVLSFKFNPAKPSRMHIPLFKLSNQDGVCEIMAKQGIQFDTRFRRRACPGGPGTCDTPAPVDCKDKSNIVWLALAIGDDGEGRQGGATLASAVEAAGLQEGGKRGFYYRIPGRAVATLFEVTADQYKKFEEAKTHTITSELAKTIGLTDENEKGRATLSVGQFGITVSLPASTGGRRTKYALDLYESTGGMKNFIMGSDALVQQSNINAITDSASTVIDTREANKKAKQPPDELSDLERQRKILEEKKKIKDLEEELRKKPDGD